LEERQAGKRLPPLPPNRKLSLKVFYTTLEGVLHPFPRDRILLDDRCREG